MLSHSTRDPEDVDVEKQENSQESAATSPAFTMQSSLGVPEPLESSCSTRKLVDLSNPTKESDQQDLGQGRWILLCLPRPSCYKVHHTCVKTARCNQEMYSQLHRQYTNNFRRWVRWMTMQKLESVSFIRVSLHTSYRPLDDGRGS